MLPAQPPFALSPPPSLPLLPNIFACLLLFFKQLHPDVMYCIVLHHESMQCYRTVHVPPVIWLPSVTLVPTSTSFSARTLNSAV